MRRVWNREGDDPNCEGHSEWCRNTHITGQRSQSNCGASVHSQTRGNKLEGENGSETISESCTIYLAYSNINFWEEKVVVAPGDPEGGEKVLYSLNVRWREIGRC